MRQMQLRRDRAPAIARDRAAMQRRTQLEAKLIAYRCGWLERDEIAIRKLERALDRVVREIGREDRMARALLDRA